MQPTEAQNKHSILVGRKHLFRKEEMKMKYLTWMLLLALAASPVLAKPKIDVKVRVNEGVGKNRQDSLSRTGSPMDGGLGAITEYYLNVIVSSDNAEVVAKNNGQWCIKGDTLLGSMDYKATLDGNSLEIEVPQKNGKIKKLSFVIIDHKWKKLSDL
jgi:hypothetical protein